MPPAARATDPHVCPLFTEAGTPHTGGAIAGGQPNVLIGGLPAARAGDTCICAGPPNAIARGSITVLVGGLPAARAGDTTVHGGAVAGGAPTVMIGG